MSQADFNIANQLFPATRADLNNQLVALASNSSGAAEPATTYANQWWYETDTHILKLRKEANNGWIEIATLDQTNSNVLSITTQGLTLGAIALTATGTEINQLSSITRGSLIYGNASGATARLAKGSAGYFLVSDGTDISWTAPAAAVSALSLGSPTGSVSPFAMDTVPTGYLECDGSAISRVTYATLFAAVAVLHGVGDGSTTFNLPDLRGEFIRGWDNSRGIDASRAIASSQGFAMESHTHPLRGNAGGGIRVLFGEAAAIAAISGGGSFGTSTNTIANNTGSGASETRPRNVAMMYCIKYQ